MSLENLTLEARDELALLAQSLAENPATRKDFLKLTKKAKPEMVIKSGLPAWGVVGDPGATVPNAQPLTIGPQFGATPFAHQRLEAFVDDLLDAVQMVDVRRPLGAERKIGRAHV